jgi:CMP-N-acetylneuraminic acid synthetase
MRAIGIVPARQGSKGLPGKNLAKVSGVSLLELAVRVGVDCPDLQQVYVSTDSRQYEKIAIAAGAVSVGLRPTRLADDAARTVDVLVDLLDKLEDQPDILVLLQPTAPVRRPADISLAIEKLQSGHTDAVVAVEPLGEPHPHKLKRIGNDGFVEPFMPGTSSEGPRQALPPVYRLSGSLYAITTQAFRQHRSLLPQRTLPLMLPSGVNIDSERDLILLRALVANGSLRLHGTGH